MPEWFRKRYFYSKRSMLKTLAWSYSFSIMLLFVGFSWRSSFLKHGYYIDYKHYIVFRGNEAIVPIYGTILCSFLMLGLAIYFTIYGLITWKKGELLDMPKKVSLICYKCDYVFECDELKSMLCPKCGYKLEDLSGFYQRHPEKK